MSSWSLLPQVSAPMPFQMAIDDLLFRKAGDSPVQNKLNSWLEEATNRPLLRFYYASEPWITIGYSVKPGEIQQKNIPVCRRITGGGCVVHGKDLLLSLVAAKGDDPSFHSVRLSYLKIHEALQQGFSLLGYESSFYRCDENLPKGADCFRFPIATDLRLQGSKVAGGGQKRSMAKLLHQESILPPSGVAIPDLMQAFCQGIEKVFKIELKPITMIPELLQEAEKIAKSKYAHLEQFSESLESKELQLIS